MDGFFQYLIKNAVKRTKNRSARIASGYGPVSVFHLGGCSSGESYGKDLSRTYLMVICQIFYPVYYYCGFAGSGTGSYQHWSVKMIYGDFLFLIKYHHKTKTSLCYDVLKKNNCERILIR